jgi:hypothetical protein
MGDVMSSVPKNSEPDAYIEITFAPNELLVPSVRRFLGDFYDRMLAAPEIADRIMVASHELLENAVRYSHDGKTKFCARLRKMLGGVDVEITTRNHACADNVGAVKALVLAMRNATNHDDYYAELMEKSAARTSGSGLGLGRVFAESGMRVECLTGDDYVELLASGRFAFESGAAS